MDENLTGTYLVRAGRWAFQDARKWLPKVRDRAVLRRHALKLRYFGAPNAQDERGELLDLNWSWIKALSPLRIGELRIEETIGGCDNLRVIFFDPQKEEKPLPMLWILGVLQKKEGQLHEGAACELSDSSAACTGAILPRCGVTTRTFEAATG